MSESLRCLFCVAFAFARREPVDHFARREWGRGKMNFDAFVEKIVDLVRRNMGKAYEIRVTKVTKNNDVELTGIVVAAKADKISPTVYLEGLYEEYLEGTVIETLADKIVDVCKGHMQDVKLDMDFFRDFTQVKDKIFYKLINFDKNRKLLEEVPYFRWHDLAGVFYYAMEEEILGRASITIHCQHMTMWGQDVDSLYRTAKQNMKEGMPELLISMPELFSQMTGIVVHRNEEVPMYVLTNQEKLYGAAALLYSEQLKNLAEQMDCDLLILPSSIHEVLLIPDDHQKGYDFYMKMVDEVNRTQVEPEEVLSYKLYRYSKNKAEVEEIFS